DSLLWAVAPPDDALLDDGLEAFESVLVSDRASDVEEPAVSKREPAVETAHVQGFAGIVKDEIQTVSSSAFAVKAMSDTKASDERIVMTEGLDPVPGMVFSALEESVTTQESKPLGNQVGAEMWATGPPQ